MPHLLSDKDLLYSHRGEISSIKRCSRLFPPEERYLSFSFNFSSTLAIFQDSNDHFPLILQPVPGSAVAPAVCCAGAPGEKSGSFPAPSKLKHQAFPTDAAMKTSTLCSSFCSFSHFLLDLQELPLPIAPAPPGNSFFYTSL